MVHAELEAEGNLLKQDHDLKAFGEKSEFLKSIGFHNSKATKMYTALVDSEEYVKGLSHRYHGLLKFILKEQLERVCEKYNLFVRDLGTFAGDIPEKNIEDLQSVTLYPEEFITLPQKTLEWYVLKNNMVSVTNNAVQFSELKECVEKNKDSIYSTLFRSIAHRRYKLSEMDMVTNRLRDNLIGYFEKELQAESGIRIRDRELCFVNSLQIAATAEMFLGSAFSGDEGHLRIQSGGWEQTQATGSVDLDPIVMLRSEKGYLILTAWGDEANDELIANQNKN